MCGLTCCECGERCQINPENYDYHRGLQCALLQRADLLSLKKLDLPSSTQTLTEDQVWRVVVLCRLIVLTRVF